MLTEYRRNTYHRMLQELAPYPFAVRYGTLMAAFAGEDETLAVTHVFHAGMYVRQITAASDTLIFGKVHKLPCLFMLLKGTIFIDSEEFVGEISAPFIINSREGTARWGYTLTECVVANVFNTDATTPEEFEQNYVEDFTCL